MSIKNRESNYLISFTIAAFLYLIIAALAGCGTTHKTQRSERSSSSEQIKKDYSASEYYQEERVVLLNAIGIDSSVDEYGIITFEEEKYNAKDSTYTKKTTKIDKGRKVTTSTKKESVKDSVHVVKVDSVGVSVSTARDTTHTVTTKEFKRKTTYGWLPWWLIWLFVIAFAAYNVIKQFRPEWLKTLQSWIRK